MCWCGVGARGLRGVGVGVCACASLYHKIPSHIGHVWLAFAGGAARRSLSCLDGNEKDQRQAHPKKKNRSHNAHEQGPAGLVVFFFHFSSLVSSFYVLLTRWFFFARLLLLSCLCLLPASSLLRTLRGGDKARFSPVLCLPRGPSVVVFLDSPQSTQHALEKHLLKPPTDAPNAAPLSVRPLFFSTG